jgi:hypothetical protein
VADLFRVAAQEFDPEIAVSSISEHPQNYNRGDMGAIEESMVAHGFLGGIGVQRSTGFILFGNHRYREACKLGAPSLPGFWLDVGDDEAARILAVDNRTSMLAKPDESRLLALLAPLRDQPRGLAGTGYSDQALGDIMRRQAALSLTGDEIDHWEGMPEFRQDGMLPAFRAVFNFPSDADADAFFAKIGLPRQRVTWWPQGDGHKGDLLESRVVNQ